MSASWCMQSTKCDITLCENSQRKNSNVHYFKVPSPNTELSKKWMIVLKDVLPEYCGSVICSLHFHKSDVLFKQINGKIFVKLKNDAVPKIQTIDTVDLTSIDQSEEKIRYVDVEKIKKGSATTVAAAKVGGIEKTPPIRIVQPQLSAKSVTATTTQAKDVKQQTSPCFQCHENMVKLSHALQKCKNFEKLNAALKKKNANLTEQIRYLLNKQNKVLDYHNSMIWNAHDENKAMPTETTTNQKPELGCTSIDSNMVKTKQQERPTTNEKPQKPEKILFVPVNATYFKCGVCEKSVEFKTSTELQKHMTDVHCKRIFEETTIRDAKAVNVTTNGERTLKLDEFFHFECYICKLKAYSLRDIRVHLTRNHEIPDKKCVVCYEICTAKELDCHVCGSEQCIQCEYCTKSFDATAKLIQHIENEHKTDTIYHRCGKCTKIYGMELLRDIHEKHHKDSSVHKCDICRTRFSHPDRLAAHMNKHSQSKLFLCSICGKGFKNEYYLKVHQMIHGEKTIKCPDCPAMFRSNIRLNRHRVMHRNIIYKFKCNFCTSIHGSKNALAQHIRIRHVLTEDDKQYACEFCPKKFFKKDKLTLHTRTHTGEKPFVCEYCPDKRYAYKQDLHKHRRIHVGDNIYTCKLCGKGFRLQKNLDEHSIDHYKEEQTKLV